LVFQPDSVCGKDALLSNFLPDQNYGDHPDFLATAWTSGGTPVVSRSLLYFDFSGIPTGTTVVSANLDLYHYFSPYNVGHSTLDGSNAAKLYRITTNWDEHTVTWNTAPAYTTVNAVSLPASLSSSDNYSVNVTTLVQDMINNPTNSFGFFFMLDSEFYYRSMLFASSDQSNPLLHPKLTLTVNSLPINYNAPCVSFSPSPPPFSNPEVTLVIPNVFTPDNNQNNDNYYITCSGFSSYEMNIYNRWGQKVHVLTLKNPLWDGDDLMGNPCRDGVYFYTLQLTQTGGNTTNKKGTITLIRNTRQ
jgi:gliding motility-associated-like protein